MTILIVFSMQLGFIFLEAGASRRKHSRAVLLKNLTDTVVTAIVFRFIGFQFSNGLEGGIIGPFGYVPDNYTIKWIIGFCFCNTTTTIVSGALAERTFNDTYLFSTILLSGFVYPIGSGWVWGGGWLQTIGFRDHAGSGVVHLIGGCTGFAGALLLGPRLGFYKNSSLDKFKVGRAKIQA